MARIRTVKPEFWKDGKVRRFSDSCALFFIGLWNFCDDEGKCRNDSFELASNMPRFKSQHVSKWIQTLFKAGSIQLSMDFRWISVVNWNHQKIDKPRSTSVRKSDIEWLPIPTQDLSTNARRLFDDHSTTIPRKDRIVKDRIVKDRIVCIDPPEMAAPGKTPGSLAFDSYAEAYADKYGEPPKRNAKLNSHFKQLVERLGDEAPDVARFYLSHNDYLYSKSGHATNLLVRDAEKLRTEWVTGNKITAYKAKSLESSETYRDQMEMVKRGEI